MNQVVTPAALRQQQSRIAVRGLRKHFVDISRQEQIVALDGIDLEIGDDEFLTILGPSGCGKTTLLNIIAGFDRATSGDVRLDGEAILKPGPDRGVVFQEYALFAWMTSRQNVEFGLRMQGVPKQERRDRAREALAKVGLDRASDRYPHELSGGMRQRVAVARALVNGPRVLLMDEPFAAVDAITRATLQEDLIRLWQQTGISIIFVTHNIDEAVFLAQRVVVMRPHPGSVKDILNIDLPYPRSRASHEFSKIFADISEALNA